MFPVIGARHCVGSWAAGGQVAHACLDLVGAAAVWEGVGLPSNALSLSAPPVWKGRDAKTAVLLRAGPQNV